MCGIIGYIGSKRAAQVLVEGLERLEYRGYDSAGIAVIEEGLMYGRKKLGRVCELAAVISDENFAANVGIGHTRWATHGKPSELNAHPQFDSDNSIAVVHNGIIENHEELKSNLEKFGTKFISQTDTEVIPHLIRANIDLGFEEAVLATVAKLEGAFALAIISEKNPEKLIAVRRGSPLVIGLGEGENFLASSYEGIAPFTNKVIYLDEGNWAIITANSCEIYNTAGNPVKPEVHEIHEELHDISKGPYEHFMLKEVFEQPDVMRRMIGERVLEDVPFFEEMNLSNSELSSIERVVVQACGTSWHAGLVGKYFLERFAGIHTDVEISSEFRYSDPILDHRTLVMAISQSGETADALEGIRLARKLAVRTLSIVNVANSSIARESHQHLHMRAGVEIGVASTKAFTSEIALLLLFSLHLGRLRWRVREEQVNQLMEALRGIPTAMDKILSDTSAIDRAAVAIKDCSSVFFIGRGISYPIALEGALKLKEISYIHAAGYPAGELKHGPLALIEENTPVIVIIPNDSVATKTLSNAQEVRSRGARIIGVVERGFKGAESVCDEVIYFPASAFPLSSVLSIIPLQLLAYRVAVLRGCDVDKPRNLAKSVTVE